MNAQNIGGIVRAILAVSAGYLAGRGIDISGLLSPEFTAAVGIVITSAWSVWAKRNAAKVAK